MNNIFEPITRLVNLDEKGWHDANNDILTLAFLVEMHVNYQHINEPLYKQMLSDELFAHKLSTNEYVFIIQHLKNLIEFDSTFAATAAGVLGEAANDDLSDFLYRKLKQRYLLNSKLAVAIIKALPAADYTEYYDLLGDIILYSNDQALIEEAKRVLTHRRGKSFVMNPCCSKKNTE